MSALDAGLPKGAAWLGSLDAGAFADLLSNPQVMMLASSAVRLNLSMLADLGVDPSGSIQIAQLGLNDAQRAGLAAMVGGSGDFSAVTKTMTPFDPTFRVVIPVKDAAKAKAAASRFVAAMGDGIDTEVAAENGVLVVDVSFTGRSKMSKQNLADLHALVKAGHADVARGPNEALHVVYRPSDLAQLGAYLQLEMAAGAIGGESLDVSQMKRIASAGVDAAKKLVALIGTPEKSAFDCVDIFGRLVAKKLTFEVRATPGAAPNLPPADAWKPGPSIAPDGKRGLHHICAPVRERVAAHGRSAECAVHEIDRLNGCPGPRSDVGGRPPLRDSPLRASHRPKLELQRQRVRALRPRGSLPRVGRLGDGRRALVEDDHGRRSGVLALDEDAVSRRRAAETRSACGRDRAALPEDLRPALDGERHDPARARDGPADGARRAEATCDDRQSARRLVSAGARRVPWRYHPLDYGIAAARPRRSARRQHDPRDLDAGALESMLFG